MNTYNYLFQAIDEFMCKHSNAEFVELKLIGYVALEMAGLPERGTKDVDVLNLGAISNDAKLIELINTEFGSRSPNSIKYGLYVDFVEHVFSFIPPEPEFILVKKYKKLVVKRLNAVDVCVSKIFSYIDNRNIRPNDKDDIFNSLDGRIVEIEKLIKRLGEALVRHEMDSRAYKLYPEIIAFVENELLQQYGSSDTKLKYEMPSWMENM